MARQPKTAQPKTKFAKLYRCFKCGFRTNDFRLVQHGKTPVTVCKNYPECKPTPQTV